MGLQTPLHLHDGRFICAADNTALADARVRNDPRVAEMVLRCNAHDELVAEMRALINEWDRQKGLFPVLERDGWMALRVGSANRLLAKVEGR